MNDSRSIVRGLVYALVFNIVTWGLFIGILALPFSIHDSVVLFGSFAIWLMAIPFYFVWKNDCGASYLWIALGVHILLTWLWTYLFFLIPDGILPHTRGWDELIYIFPLFGIPIAGALPIAIDILIYIGKAIWMYLGKRSQA